MNKWLIGASGQLLRAANEAKFRNRLLKGLAVFLVLQIYFVRELIAAEALFILGFLAIAGIVGICYLLGTIGLKSIDLTETGLKMAAQGARRSVEALEGIARNSIRHLPSETTK